MTTYLISYDLAAPQTNKQAIASAIMMLGQSWARPLEQTWYLRADIAESDIEAVLGGLLGDDDGLLVQVVEKDAVLANASLRWFKQRASRATATASSNVVAFPVVSERPDLAPDMTMTDAAPLAEAV
jgi:hypothetical protein